MLLRPGLAFPSSQVQNNLIKALKAPIGTLDEGMNVRQFVAESYPGDTRGEMWRAVLAELHLRSVVTDGETGRYSSATLRGDRENVILARLVASSQTLVSVPQRSRMLMGIIPLDAAIEVVGGNFGLQVESGALVVLQMDRSWEMKLPDNNRILAFGLSDAALQRRGAGWTPFADPRCYLPKGLASVCIRTLESAALEIDAFSGAEWQSFEQFIADLFVTMIVETESADMRSTPSLAALFNRITVAIEKRLHDADLSSAKVARVEGISERYLQKLFEQNGESFTHYLRERRLQRARAALVTSAEVRLSVADVAYSCGFGDAANFNRAFKERFGLPPGAFRSRHLENQIDGGSTEQRGWPVKALAAKRSPLRGRVDSGATKRDESVPEAPVRPTTAHHKLSINASNVHWGYFSRSLAPVLEISSGDTVEIETLSQHASDAPELMIEGDAAAEDVFHWTKHRKSVDRRGAGPVDASIFGRGAGEGSACISAPGRST